MNVEVKVNELPESVADGTLVAWHKQPGDTVKADEPLAEIETDKVMLEIAAPSAGVLGPHLRKKGESIKRGDVITTIAAGAAATKVEAPAKMQPTAP
jgi:pyruvate/2-oxoglutarate dehydrogenase complex dihydrolipoamide acyltransferase (E2) component